MTSDDAGFSRRAFLRTAAGTATASTAVGTAAAAEETKTKSSGSSGGPTKTVKVGPSAKPVFKPADLKITPGTTVKFVWESDNHNIVVASKPDGASWKGSKGGKDKLYNKGHTHTHTFKKKGTYEYFCQPHKAAGMTGTIEVVESLQSGGGGSSIPEVPETAKTLGIATAFAMVSTLGLAYFFLKYGGDYDTPE